NTKFKVGADMTCDSLGKDQETIRRAIDQLPSSGGWIHLLEGDYWFDAPAVLGSISTGPLSVKITGAGIGATRIHAKDGATLHSLIQLNRLQGNYTFEDFTLDGNKGNGATITAACLASSPGSGGLNASVVINRVESMNSA